MEGANERISKELVKQKLQALKDTPKPAPPVKVMEERPQRNAFVDAAAVLAYFDLDKFNPLPQEQVMDDKEKMGMVNCLIGCSLYLTDIVVAAVAANKETKPGDTVFLSLRDDARIATLQALVQEGKIDAALQANPTIAFDEQNVLQKMLTRCLQKKTPDIHLLNLEELNALIQVTAWLKNIPGYEFLPPAETLHARIEIREMLTPLRHLTGVYEEGIFRSTFRGRHAETTALRTYVGVAPPKSLLESVSRGIGNLADSIFSNSKDPMLIFGVGGIGKSTLLAHFILEHYEAHTQDKFPFVYLDFDRPQLNALEPDTLLIEAGRQLGIQYRDQPELSAAFQSFFEYWNQVYGSLIDNSSSTSFILRSLESGQQKEADRAGIQEEFLGLVSRLATDGNKPFLVVLDTFEEVQYKGEDYVASLYDFMTLLRRQYARLRVVIAGRAPITHLKTTPLELGDLDREAAAGYLERCGITDAAIAKNIAAMIGGNPLTLKLAAELVKGFGEKELKTLRITKKKYGILNERLPEQEIQGMLYQRILRHLGNAELKKLANPGMVLRRITPEIILEVLAGPCQLAIGGIEDARKLFDQMKKELSLIIPVNANELRHRPDVRRVMLKLVRKSEEGKIAEEIDHRAVEFYKDKEGVVNRAEEIYHRLVLGESPRSVEARWLDGVQKYLLTGLEELPDKAQAFILGKAGIESAKKDVWESADAEDQIRHIARQAANLLNSGRAEQALNLVEPSMPGKGNAILGMLKVRALSQLERYEEAKEYAKEMLTSYYAAEFSTEVINELQQVLQHEAKPKQASPKRGTGGGGDLKKPLNVDDLKYRYKDDNDMQSFTV
ncbi:ATP-binding protein [Paraflavitalea sp. CAU 1676]|uniref:ATP-binding protein n=1 Tax=Paraflavitalea sp. CAU 1676 TaxID=3032598 RepID=UPI0023DBE8DA|nr:ATP-binding protein [Paraflavitalea sp. CAU 1676]MDF2188440.1 ATP-binding protein [Paraflavitalea sp. CAU 1676]